MRPPDIAERLDHATRHHRLLEHPFYKAWANGRLTRGDLAFYSTQYWRQVEAFPGYLRLLADRLPEGSARTVVLGNLADERDGDHPRLWLDFAAALGVNEAVIRGSQPEPETTRCVKGFEAAATSAPMTWALGMIYGYESQTPAVATTKVTGLRAHYGIDGPGVGYFELHGVLDVEHAADLAVAIGDVAGNEAAVADAEAGARTGAEAIWGLLDGVARVRGITC